MSKTEAQGWPAEFGLAGRRPPSFYRSGDDVAAAAPQAHLLRRAFEVLELDGVLCADHSPLAYFRQVKRITPKRAYELHRTFWNHGGAPLLVLFSDDRVHVYSGLARPGPPASDDVELPCLIEVLDRTSDVLQGFVVSIESGEFFRRHSPSFDPSQRVDRHLLDNLEQARAKLIEVSGKRASGSLLDALLCRLAFTCYLFDREVIGESYLTKLNISNASDLRSLLSITPTRSAKSGLYKLFEALKQDFNGDLFSPSLADEKNAIGDEHIVVLRDFFRGTDVATGQTKLFWPYDFKFIPVETISAIYERFLDAEEKKQGAFYTPRFLAEVVLDMALEGCDSLVGKRFLDPACGSGIFLVGLFNRLAEEWKQANSRARNDRKARELIRLLQESLFGVDISRTACFITAFSLYLAYLDQLSPRDIQALQENGRALPPLVEAEDASAGSGGRNIICADFFDTSANIPSDAHVVIGNPPWGSIATAGTPAARWCSEHSLPIPDKQIASAFTWKASRHVSEEGRVCFLLPHGMLFNHSRSAILFQQAWVTANAIDRVLNLTDLRFLLFEKAIHPAIVVRYRSTPPAEKGHCIEYWTPKADWTVTEAEVITIGPQDRTTVSLEDLLSDLESADAPRIWKSRYWATPRDWRLVDRLLDLPRLREVVAQSREKDESKRWLIAEGFQPVGNSDDPNRAVELQLPSRSFIEASSDAINLFLLADDCERRPTKKVLVRNRSNKNTSVFSAPHVLVTKGFNRVAYADFDVSFRHAARGITGPVEDSNLLRFLAAFLRTPLARYLVFHTSSNWGIYRPEVHVEELLRIPFPLPAQLPNQKRRSQIVREVASIVEKASTASANDFLARPKQINDATRAIEPLVYEYFDVIPQEADLIRDTCSVIVPSVQPTTTRMPVETVKPASQDQCDDYATTAESMLNEWAKRGGSRVTGRVLRSEKLGLAVAVFEKSSEKSSKPKTNSSDEKIIEVLAKIRKAASQNLNTLDIVRGVLVFDRNRLYAVKPLGRRYWTRTVAMNDADEIAGTVLMRSPQEHA